MARHETMNKRFKKFRVLSGTFRHDLEFHQICFYAVAAITQMKIQHDEPLYEL
jgi:hypothetical protein